MGSPMSMFNSHVTCEHREGIREVGCAWQANGESQRVRERTSSASRWCMSAGFITQQSAAVQLTPSSADGKHSRITSASIFIVPSGRLLLEEPGRGKHPVALAIMCAQSSRSLPVLASAPPMQKPPTQSGMLMVISRMNAV